ncbi:MAG TPA: disulfide bond formation protein B [Actinomycetota bacterium]|nr:disulfide bond formation protein B [Actinomycetota bacterium]
MDVDTMATLFALLTVAADLAVVGMALVVIVDRDGSRGMRPALIETLGPSALWLAFLVALTATLGSLYLSEVAHFVPCELCWYQRIAMYPLAPILFVAAYRRDPGVWRYVVPVAAIGAAISIYHYQLERFPEQASASCSPDAPCTVVWIWRFHFISIPFMALSAFALIGALVLVARSGTTVDTTDDGARLTGHSDAVGASEIDGRGR